MNALKTKATNAVAAVKRNERRILLSALGVVTTIAALEQAGIRQHNDFLSEKGLFEEFYGFPDRSES